MDYAQVIEDYLASKGNSNTIEVTRHRDGYIAEVYYGDEEICNYLGTGATTTLYFTDLQEDPEDNTVFCHCDLLRCVVPGINLTGKDNPGMALMLLEEVTRATSRLLHSLDYDQDIWLDLN